MWVGLNQSVEGLNRTKHLVSWSKREFSSRLPSDFWTINLLSLQAASGVLNCTIRFPRSWTCCCCCCQIASVMSDSVWPHRWQPTRTPHPWDSSGKNTGVDCHFLLQCMKVESENEVAQSCPTLGDPVDCSLPGSSIHGISQARVLDVT